MTLAFAVFAVGFLAAILTLGYRWGRIGRRPVLIGALLIQLGSIVMFLVAPNIGVVACALALHGLRRTKTTTLETTTRSKVPRRRLH
jgi:predicted MFS family arabinose efflux permease